MGSKQLLAEINGHVSPRDTEYYHMVINAGFLPDGKRNRISISTYLPLKGNQRKANSLLNETISQLRIAREKTGLASLKEIYRLICDVGVGNLDSIAYSSPMEKEIHPSTGNNPLFSDVIDEWLLYHSTRVSGNSNEKYKHASKHIKAYFENIPVQDVTARLIAQYFVKKSAGNPDNGVKPLSAATLADHKTVISQSLKYAKTIMKVITENPAADVLPPKREHPAPKFFSKDELNRVFELIQGSPIAPAVILAGSYGLRRQEVLGLKWSAINLSDMTFTVRHTITLVGSKEVAADRTKTTSSLRTLNLTASIREYLQNLLEYQNAMKAIYGNSYDNNDYICKWSDGRRLKPGYVTRKWGAFLAANDFPHITFHDLRHSSASLLIRLGFSLKDVQEWLGHSDIKSTARYTHLINEDKHRVAEKVEKALSIPKIDYTVPDNEKTDYHAEKSKNGTAA